jgi:hypothetical protein
MNVHDWWDATVTASVHAGWFKGDVIEGTLLSKRIKALGNLYGKLAKLNDSIDFDSLPPTVIFAPPVDCGGYVKQAIFPTGTVFMYLAPTLEFDSQRDVDFTVAHEFAHVVLGHYANLGDVPSELPHEKQPHEIAADALAAKWGFPKRKSGMSGFGKMLNHHAKRKAA